MAKRKKSSRSRAVSETPGSIARSAHGTLRSYHLGALPIIDHILKRMKLEKFLQDYLPRENRRPYASRTSAASRLSSACTSSPCLPRRSWSENSAGRWSVKG